LLCSQEKECAIGCYKIRRPAQLSTAYWSRTADVLFTTFLMCPTTPQAFFLTFDSCDLQSQIWSGYHVIQYSNTACYVTRHWILPYFRSGYPRQPMTLAT